MLRGKAEINGRKGRKEKRQMSEKQNEKCVTYWFINEINSTICIKINKTKKILKRTVLSVEIYLQNYEDFSANI